MAEPSVSLFDRLFATTIAFVLPGMAILAGAATLNPVIAGWFGKARDNPSIVGFLYVIAAALTIGMTVTAIRWWIFERCRLMSRGPIVPKAAPINEAQRSQHLVEYEDLRFQHYFHYLALGNMAIALPVAATLALSGLNKQLLWWQASLIAGGTVLCIGILAAGAREAVLRYEARRLRLLGPATTAAAGAVPEGAEEAGAPADPAS